MANDGLTQASLGPMFFGTAFSFMLNGISSCQMIWYFRSQANRTSTIMKVFIVGVWLSEALNCVFAFLSTWNTIFGPEIAYAETHANPCTYWSGPTQAVTSAICTYSVEGFFFMRVWRLTERKKLMVLVLILYLAGEIFGIAQIVRSYRYLCDPNIPDLNLVFVYGTLGTRLCGDGVVAVSMSYMLYVRSSGFTRNTNTIRIVRGLILWSISTGILTWITSILYIISVLGFFPGAYAIYYLRGGLYVNAMLAQLNARALFREIAQESIPLSSISLGETPSQRFDRQLQALEPIPE